MVREKTLESPLNCKEIKSVNPKGDQPWIFIRMTEAEAEAPVLWPPDAKSIGKDPDAGEDWRQKYKRVTVDEMAGWHHQCSGHELGQTPGDDEGQGILACCSLWSHKESDMTWQLNNIQIIYFLTELWEFLSSKEFVHFIWVSKLIEKKLFIICSYYLTPVRTFNDTTFLIHFIANL